MRHFYRTHVAPAAVLSAADEFFPTLELTPGPASTHSRRYSGPLGALQVTAESEGGHYTFIAVETNQVGESRLDRNVKKFFVSVHRGAEPGHVPSPSY